MVDMGSYKFSLLLTGNINSNAYLDILENFKSKILLPKNYNKKKIMQDNAPAHTSKVIKDCF